MFSINFGQRRPQLGTIGLLIFAVILIAFIALAIFGRPSKKPETSPYSIPPDNERMRMVDTLVDEVGPKLSGKPFSKKTVDRMVGHNPVFDQEMYYHLRNGLGRGNLTKANFVDVLSR